MSDRPLLTSLDLWGAHERCCLGLLRAALALLAAESTGEAEVDLNRDLYRAIVRVSHAAAAAGDPPPLVVPEGRNPPVASDHERAAREFKIPDFYWAYIDDLVADPADAARQFVVECKRLTAASEDWVYTEQYVRSGIARFMTLGHGYGMGTPSGAMVGYVQRISLDDALDEVNGYAAVVSIPQLSANGRSAEESAEFEHSLSRSFRESPFRLMHLWVRVAAAVL
jgi:hypothetical protein